MYLALLRVILDWRPGSLARNSLSMLRQPLDYSVFLLLMASECVEDSGE